MTPERWDRIKALFDDARNRPPGDRASFLAAACQGDERLRREVEALLDQPVSSTGFAEFVGGGWPSAMPESLVTFSGKRVGVYAIHELLGRGGMGEVYRAHDSRLDRDVAIKILPLVSSREPDRLQRFEREARMLAALNHPHVGAIYGVEEIAEEDGRRVPALVLELVDGETLADRLRRGPIPLIDAVGVAKQIADGLEAAHRTGIVHRDLKPANIKITAGGIVKVLDFGLAKAAGIEHAARPSDVTIASERDGPQNVTRVGAILGTIEYMSPEQARGETVDHRTDIWAFGCVLYEMLTGRPAYARGSSADTIAAILEREPDWNAVPAAASTTLRSLLRRCLEKDPDHRLHSIAEARAVLDELLAPPAPRHAAFAAAAVSVLVLAAAAAAFWWSRTSDALIDPSRWVQMTSFPDAVSQPALSPDGEWLAFIRGPNTFTTPGQVYVKQLPDGAAVPLTDDDLIKMSPVFSPDGRRIAYTVNSSEEPWATWIVPVLRGTPQRWLRNASGLTWTAAGGLLFSEVVPASVNHMAVVVSDEERTTTRTVYVPPHVSGMAHRSALSPDRNWVLVVEMNERGVWVPCRLVPADGSSRGTAVGPPQSRCTDVAWAPDGRFMYFTADAGDGFHLWRQRFPDGPAEQITQGPTAEEGLAIAADGRSLVTAVGLRHRSIWIRDASGDRQLSGEGYAFWPLFSRDGQTLVYRVAAAVSSGQSPTQLWKMDLRTGTTERLFPGRLVIQYDLSLDDRLVAVVRDDEGRSQVWVASLDGTQPPRQVPGVEGDSARLGVGDDIVFLGDADGGRYLFRVDANGAGRRRVSDTERGQVFGSVSPDGRWISTVGRLDGRPTMAAFSTDGTAAPVPILTDQAGAATSRLRWSPDGRRVWLNIQLGDASAFASGRTYVIPLRPGSMLPDIPAGGFRSEEEIAAIPGVEVIPFGDVAPGPVTGTYAYSRETVTRNLYRIPLP